MRDVARDRRRVRPRSNLDVDERDRARPELEDLLAPNLEPFPPARVGNQAPDARVSLPRTARGHADHEGRDLNLRMCQLDKPLDVLPVPSLVRGLDERCIHAATEPRPAEPPVNKV